MMPFITRASSDSLTTLLKCTISQTRILQNYGYTCSIDSAKVLPGSQFITIEAQDYANRSEYSENKLENLIISNSSTPFVIKEFFSKFRYLQTLQIVNSSLKNLQPGVFASNTKLIRKVSMSKNNISNVPRSAFKGLSNLIELWLVKNEIQTINGYAFHGLFNLKILVLSDNQITHLPSNIFYTLFRLEFLGLSSNQIEVIGENIFNYMHLLETIDFEDNNIKLIDKNFIHSQFLLARLNLLRNDCVTEQFFMAFNEPRDYVYDALEPCFPRN